MRYLDANLESNSSFSIKGEVKGRSWLTEEQEDEFFFKEMNKDTRHRVLTISFIIVLNVKNFFLIEIPSKFFVLSAVSSLLS